MDPIKVLTAKLDMASSDIQDSSKKFQEQMATFQAFHMKSVEALLARFGASNDQAPEPRTIQRQKPTPQPRRRLVNDADDDEHDGGIKTTHDDLDNVAHKHNNGDAGDKAGY